MLDVFLPFILTEEPLNTFHDAGYHRDLREFCPNPFNFVRRSLSTLTDAWSSNLTMLPSLAWPPSAAIPTLPCSLPFPAFWEISVFSVVMWRTSSPRLQSFVISPLRPSRNYPPTLILSLMPIQHSAYHQPTPPLSLGTHNSHGPPQSPSIVFESLCLRAIYFMSQPLRSRPVLPYFL